MFFKSFFTLFKKIEFKLITLTCFCLLQTFRPKKKFSPGTLRYSLHKQAQASLSSGINLRSVVQLPEGEDLNDWIAVHGKYS